MRQRKTFLKGINISCGKHGQNGIHVELECHQHAQKRKVKKYFFNSELGSQGYILWLEIKARGVDYAKSLT